MRAGEVLRDAQGEEDGPMKLKISNVFFGEALETRSNCKHMKTSCSSTSEQTLIKRREERLLSTLFWSALKMTLSGPFALKRIVL